MKRQDELRKLPAASLYKVATILEINHDWQKVMSLISKNLESDHFEPKYNYEHMRLIEEHAKKTNRKCAEILFEEWGTSGRVRPTLNTLMDVLRKADMYRAADEVAHMLQEPIPDRPNNGPAADITISITSELNNESMEQRLNSMASIKSDNFSSKLDNICNGTTIQMKDTSDLIKFSRSNIVNGAPSIGHQPTAQVAPEDSDYMKFTKSTLNSQDLPDISALLQKTGMKMNTETQSTDMGSPSVFSQYVPAYQTSVPNIDIFHMTIDSAILEDKKLIHFGYKELETITKKFTETFSNEADGPIGKIGSGGFGDVFVGTHNKYGSLAVKSMRIIFQMNCDLDTAMKVFNTEVKSLSYLRHENIVPILGYSIDGPTPCIVCKYIDGGSLQQKIAAKVLTEYQRINIMKGTAKGLKYIHNSEKPPVSGSQSESQTQTSKKSFFLHGDVKSANILLTKDCIPKLCDFGLAKQLDTTFITKSMMGTQAYMAPEGFSGTVTQKNDIFSYGIVLLELLTGLTPIVMTDSENINIKTYIEDRCLNDDISNVLDPVVDTWTTAQKVYKLAKCCLVWDKNERPTIDEVCDMLGDINLEE